jgi:hypothetical protein
VGAIEKVLKHRTVSELKRERIVRRASRDVMEEGEWPSNRRLHLWFALREAAGLPVPMFDQRSPSGQIDLGAEASVRPMGDR